MKIRESFQLTKTASVKFILTVTVFFGIPTTTIAATAGGTLPVSALVTANCSLSSTVMNFGNYDPITVNVNSPLPASTTFQIACTKGANVAITLNNGLYSANAAGTTRAMSSGNGHYLSYELYSDPGHSTVWSTATPVQFTSASSNALIETVYGQIPASQNAFAGYYSDTVTITATF